MFDATTGAARKGRKKDPVSAALSLLLHLGIAFAIIWVGSKEVIEKPKEATEVTFFSAPPPPPPPPPATKKKKKKKKKKKVEKKPEIKPEELVQPEEIPEETPEPVEEETTEEEVEEEDDEDDGVDGGVEGGIEGGVKGGVKGGEVGGKVGSIGASGLCRKPGYEPEYTDTARENRVYGKFMVRGLAGRDGKWVKRKDPMCEPFAGVEKSTLRKSWHPNRCIFVEDFNPAHELLVYNSLMHFAAIRCKPQINSQGKGSSLWWRLPYAFRAAGQ